MISCAAEREGWFFLAKCRTTAAKRKFIMRSVVITGASTGIGWAAAKLLIERGFRVFGSVRKQADADRLKAEFGANFTPAASGRDVWR